jgi:outer membrane lipoprotein SlyB
MKRLLFSLGAVAFVFAAGCASKRPVLYPNEHLQHVGDATAQQDIDDCLRRAEQYAHSSQAADTAKDTAVGAGAGAAIGAVGGAVSGNAGQGAAVGAATGGTAGLLKGIFSSNEPTGLQKGFVERCLRDKGYETIGWE